MMCYELANFPICEKRQNVTLRCRSFDDKIYQSLVAEWIRKWVELGVKVTTE